MTDLLVCPHCRPIMSVTQPTLSGVARGTSTQEGKKTEEEQNEQHRQYDSEKRQSFWTHRLQESLLYENGKMCCVFNMRKVWKSGSDRPQATEQTSMFKHFYSLIMLTVAEKVKLRTSAIVPGPLIFKGHWSSGPRVFPTELLHVGADML